MYTYKAATTFYIPARSCPRGRIHFRRSWVSRPWIEQDTRQADLSIHTCLICFRTLFIYIRQRYLNLQLRRELSQIKRSTIMVRNVRKNTKRFYRHIGRRIAECHSSSGCAPRFICCCIQLERFDRARTRARLYPWPFSCFLVGFLRGVLHSAAAVRFYDPPNFPYACNGSRYQSAQYANRLSKYCYLFHLSCRTRTYAANGLSNNKELPRANRATATINACRSSSMRHKALWSFIGVNRSLVASPKVPLFILKRLNYANRARRKFPARFFTSARRPGAPGENGKLVARSSFASVNPRYFRRGVIRARLWRLNLRV